jgi:hypothetical protein
MARTGMAAARARTARTAVAGPRARKARGLAPAEPAVQAEVIPGRLAPAQVIRAHGAPARYSNAHSRPFSPMPTIVAACQVHACGSCHCPGGGATTGR